MMFLYACPVCGSTIHSPLTPDEFESECRSHYPHAEFEWVEPKKETNG